jgi:hypothetical protein
LGLSETIEDLERAEEDEEYLKLLVQECQVTLHPGSAPKSKTAGTKSGVVAPPMVSAITSTPYKPPASGPELGSAADTINVVCKQGDGS